MATLLSVNVGMPEDVSWQGRTVHTGAWKSPVRGPRTVRRLNIDGDGQGDLAGHGGEIRAVLVYQLESYRYWQTATRSRRPDLRELRGELHRRWPARRRSMHRRPVPHRRSRIRSHPAARHLLPRRHAPGRTRHGLPVGRPPSPRLLPACPRRGTRPGRRRDHPDAQRPGELSVADTDALLYLPGRDPAKLRTALNIPALSPGWQQSFRELAAARQPQQEPGWPGERAGTQQPREEPGWPGFKTMRVARIVPETPTVSSVYLDATDGTPLPEARPGQYLSIRLAVGEAAPAVRSYSLSVRAHRRHLPHQRQARAPRAGQQLHPCHAPPRGPRGHRKPPRNVRTRRRHLPGRPRLRRDRCHSRARHAPPTRRRTRPTPCLVDPHRPRPRPARFRRRGPRAPGTTPQRPRAHLLHRRSRPA